MTRLVWILLTLIIFFGVSCTPEPEVTKDGIDKTYFESGKIREEIPMKNGKPHGLVLVYFENGNVHQESHFENGLPNGVSKFYRGDGSLWFESNFKDGKQQGFDRFYDKKGNLTSETNYENGKKNGKGVTYNKDGAVCHLIYKDDEEVEKNCEQKKSDPVETTKPEPSSG